VHKALKVAFGRHEAVKAALSAGPQLPLTVTKHHPHEVVGQAIGDIWLVLKRFKAAGNGVVAAQPSPTGAYPQLALLILGQGQNKVAAQAARALGVVAKHPKLDPVVAAQPVLGAKPQKALLVLQDAVDAVFGQALGGRERTKGKSRRGLSLGREAYQACQQA
jgi:hypothetical protein